MAAKWLFIGIAALASAVSGPAAAKMIASARVGAWTVGAHTNDVSGRFSHCAASVPYKSGVLLLFSIDRTGWKMGLANSSWRLAKGERHPIAYQIDNGSATRATAIAASQTLAVIPLQDSTRLFASFKRGRMLRVQAAGQTFGFNLLDSSRALEMTLDCAKRYRNYGPSAPDANPFRAPTPPSNTTNPFRSATPAPQPQPGSSDAGRKAEAAALVANVLSTASVQGFRIIEEVPPELKQYDVVWAAPGLVGGLRINPVASPDQAAITLPAADSAACRGTFASARMPGATAGAIQLRTACATPGAQQANTRVIYSLLRRPRGGTYIFVTLERGEARSSANAEEIGGRLLTAGATVIGQR